MIHIPLPKRSIVKQPNGKYIYIYIYMQLLKLTKDFKKIMQFKETRIKKHFRLKI